jgi:hypothetical protein
MTADPGAARTGPRIFISYRRSDAPVHAGRMHDALVQHFGSEHVFMDVDKIEPGLSFRQEIDQALVQCDALLAVIGPRWLARGKLGRRRLDDPDDLGRVEIATALERDIVVIPVLVDHARMPTPPPTA